MDYMPHCTCMLCWQVVVGHESIRNYSKLFETIRNGLLGTSKNRSERSRCCAEQCSNARAKRGSPAQEMPVQQVFRGSLLDAMLLKDISSSANSVYFPQGNIFMKGYCSRSKLTITRVIWIKIALVFRAPILGEQWAAWLDNVKQFQVDSTKSSKSLKQQKSELK